MKPHLSIRSSHPSGFTLVELLVVIAIVAILVSLGFAGAQMAMEATRRSQATVLMTNVKTSISFYQTDYNRLPIPPDHSGEDYLISEQEDWKDLTMMLIGNKDPISGEKIDQNRFQNPRDNTYLEVQRKDLDQEGAVKDPSFGKTIAYFVLVLDADLSGSVVVPPDSATLNLTEETSVNSPIAIYSRSGGTEQKPLKAIISW